MKPLVIFHKNCQDGFCSAWLAKKALKDAEFLPAQYGDKPPEVNGRGVYILDFSYKRDVLLDMQNKVAYIYVLDHHKTAKEDLADLDFCTFDMNKSGAGLTYDFFRLYLQPHWIIDYVQDRDLWKWKLPHSQEVNAFVSSLPFDFEVWDNLPSLDEAIFQGKAIRRYMERLVDNLFAFSREVVFDGYKVLAANSSTLNSEVGNCLAKGRPFGIVWFQRQDSQFVYSLRSTPDGIDVSELAKSHGGGGHKNAAGFISNELLI